MEKNSNYKLYKIRHRSMMADLFEEHCCLLGKEVLDNVFVRDFLNMKEIPFIDKGKQYQRQHDWIFRGDVAKIQIGVEGEYGIVGASTYINYSELRYEPYVAIEDDTTVFNNIDVVADMVERSLNWVYKNSGITLYLEPWIIADGEAIHWLKDCCEAHDKAKLVENFDANAKWDLKTVVNRLINKHKKKLGVSPPKMENTTADKNYEDYILVKNKASFLKQAHEFTDMQTSAKVVIAVQKAMRDAGVLSHDPAVPHTVFQKEFGYGRGRSRTSYSDYLGSKSYVYDNNDLYKYFLSKFVELKKKVMEH